MTRVRHAAVAGLFYPGDPTELRRDLDRLLAAPSRGPPPKACIAPHAGYAYSAPIAADAYRRIAQARDTIERVVVLGPAHRYPLRGIATHGADVFRTPLGDIAVDPVARDLPGVRVVNAAHEGEHALEVHLPFLQAALGEFRLVPLLVGESAPDDVADVLDRLWGGAETLIVVSSDLSHFHDHSAAQRRDKKTAAAIEALDEQAVGPYDACGNRAIGGLIVACRRHGLHLVATDLRTSADTAGTPERVVGYGAFVSEAEPARRPAPS